MKAITSLFAITLLSNAAFGFETGKYECVSEKAGANGERAMATVHLSKTTLKTDAGNVVLPYMEYTFDDKQGNKAYAKGIAQISGETWSNSMDAQTIQIDSNSFAIVFKGNKIISRIGFCNKVQ